MNNAKFQYVTVNPSGVHISKLIKVWLAALVIHWYNRFLAFLWRWKRKKIDSIPKNSFLLGVGGNKSKQINQQMPKTERHTQIHIHFCRLPCSLLKRFLKSGTAAHMCFIRLSGQGRSRQRETVICMQAHRDQWERFRSWTNSQTLARNIFHPCFKIRML